MRTISSQCSRYIRVTVAVKARSACAADKAPAARCPDVRSRLRTSPVWCLLDQGASTRRLCGAGAAVAAAGARTRRDALSRRDSAALRRPAVLVTHSSIKRRLWTTHITAEQLPDRGAHCSVLPHLVCSSTQYIQCPSRLPSAPHNSGDMHLTLTATHVRYMYLNIAHADRRWGNRFHAQPARVTRTRRSAVHRAQDAADALRRRRH